MTPYGRRHPDFIETFEDGTQRFIEVKSGGAKRSRAQELKDDYIEEIFGIPTHVEFVP